MGRVSPSGKGVVIGEYVTGTISWWGGLGGELKEGVLLWLSTALVRARLGCCL